MTDIHLPADGDANLTSPLAEALTHASWRLRRASVKELAPFGLTFAQSRVLRILARRDEPMRIGDLAARFEVAPRSATSMIDSLETLGLVERRADPTDRRSVLVGLTADGLALMTRIGEAAPRQRRGAVRPPHDGAAGAVARDAQRADRAGRGLRRTQAPARAPPARTRATPARRPPEPRRDGAQRLHRRALAAPRPVGHLGQDRQGHGAAHPQVRAALPQAADLLPRAGRRRRRRQRRQPAAVPRHHRQGHHGQGRGPDRVARRPRGRPGARRRRAHHRRALHQLAGRRGPRLRPAHPGVRPRAAHAAGVLHAHADRRAREPPQQRRDRRPGGVHRRPLHRDRQPHQRRHRARDHVLPELAAHARLAHPPPRVPAAGALAGAQAAGDHARALRAHGRHEHHHGGALQRVGSAPRQAVRPPARRRTPSSARTRAACATSASPSPSTPGSSSSRCSSRRRSPPPSSTAGAACSSCTARSRWAPSSPSPPTSTACTGRSRRSPTSTSTS